jgi:hypothetical protein
MLALTSAGIHVDSSTTNERRPPVQFVRDDGAPVGNAGNAHPVAGLLDEDLVGFRWWRLVKHPIGCAANAFLGAGDSDEGFSLIVVGSNVLIRDGPIGPKSITIVGFEVVIGEAEGHSSVMVSPPADDARAEPLKLASRTHCIRLAIQLPASAGGCEIPEGLAFAEIGRDALFRAPVIHLVRPHVLLEFFGRVEHWTCFQ